MSFFFSNHIFVLKHGSIQFLNQSIMTSSFALSSPGVEIRLDDWGLPELCLFYILEKGWGLSWFWLPYSRLIWMWYAQKCGQAQDIAIRTKISNMPAYLVEVSNVHLHSMENMHEFCNRNDSVGNCSYLKGACRCALNVDSLIFHKPHEIFYLCCSPQNSQQWLGGVCAMLWRLHS